MQLQPQHQFKHLTLTYPACWLWIPLALHHPRRRTNQPIPEVLANTHLDKHLTLHRSCVDPIPVWDQYSHTLHRHTRSPTPQTTIDPIPAEFAHINWCTNWTGYWLHSLTLMPAGQTHHWQNIPIKCFPTCWHQTHQLLLHVPADHDCIWHVPCRWTHPWPRHCRQQTLPPIKAVILAIFPSRTTQQTRKALLATPSTPHLVQPTPALVHSPRPMATNLQ
jgi:hypothetical protein